MGAKKKYEMLLGLRSHVVEAVVQQTDELLIHADAK